MEEGAIEAPIKGAGWIKDKRARPDCRCHREPMTWKGDPKHRDGGYWLCTVKKREAGKRHKSKLRDQRRNKVRACGNCGADFRRSDEGARTKYCSARCSNEARSASQARRHPGTKASPPVVYLLQAESGGPVKVGKSTKLMIDRRVAFLQCGNPEPLVVRRLLDGGHPLERKIAKEHSDLRIRGEWYDAAILDRVIA